MTLTERAPGRRVSLVIHSFDRGGSGRVAGHLARGFADHGMDVDVLAFRRDGPVEDAVIALMGPGVPVRFLGGSRGPRPLDLLLGLPKLVRVLRSERPEIVLAAANNAALVTALAFRLAGLSDSRLFLKTTNPIASSRHRGLSRWVRRLGYRLAFRWASAVLTLSAEESREMAAAFPASRNLFRDVANPYVTPAMLQAPGKVAHRGGKIVITLARLERQKRLERLIRAFALVRDKSATLLILGEGAQRAALVTLIASLDLEQRVTMPGHVGDVAPALHAADLFVLTSDYEGLPAALLEAMAANCPVLSTPCFPSARALLTEGEGCGVIENSDPASLAKLIDAHLQQSRPTGLRRIAERYSIARGICSHLTAMLAVDRD